MLRSPTMREARAVYAFLLEERKAEIAARLKEIESSVGEIFVIPYYTTVLDEAIYPLLMIEQAGEDLQWQGVESLCDATFEITIWGLVRGYASEVEEDLVGEFAGAARDVLNANHAPFDHGNWEWWFDENHPLDSIRYGAAQFGNAVIRGFTARGEIKCRFKQQPRNR